MPPPRLNFSCPFPHCEQACRNQSGLTRHINAKHREITPVNDEAEDPAKSTFLYHRHLTGHYLPSNTPPEPPPPPPPVPADVTDDDAWNPFHSRAEFDFAHWHFVTNQSSAGGINKNLDILTATLLPTSGRTFPWKNAQDVYDSIDSIQASSTPFRSIKMRYTGPLPPGTPPKWMTETYEMFVRDSRLLLHQQLASEQFRDALTPRPYLQFDRDGKRVFSNFMSGDWAFKQADIIAHDENTHGAMFVPVIGGSDKTTVSVATGHQEYHPVYQSPGCITNNARRARGDEVVRCADGYYRRVVYGLGPYIADYPEQVWLSGIVQGWCPKCDAEPDDLDSENARRRTHEKTDFLISVFDPGILWSDFGVRVDVVPFTHEFPRADIHELLSPDLLHQVIKGTFKDHLVTWIGEYLNVTYGAARAKEILDDIDRRLSAVPSFPGLRRFPEGRDFAQWTGDDSKALMRVYLAAIAGHVPSDMVKCFAAFLDFCYIARRNAITAPMIDDLRGALRRFHHHRQVFIETGVRPDGISLPRQHALKHYIDSIVLFGSPNGLCSSITESKHIKAVKEPWRRSSRNMAALRQMLLTNVRLDKMQAAQLSFEKRGMLQGTATSFTADMLAGRPIVMAEEDMEEEEEDEGPPLGPRALSSVDLAATRQAYTDTERDYPRYVQELSQHISKPQLPLLLRQFLYSQLHPDCESITEIPPHDLPYITTKIDVFHSAVARFYAPSDLCGAGGMRRERIRSTPSWYGCPRRDTVLINVGGDPSVMKDAVDNETGMWIVEPEYLHDGSPSLEVIHLETIARGVHLIGIGNKELLEKHGIQTVVDLPGVGENLRKHDWKDLCYRLFTFAQEHIYVPTAFELKEGLESWDELQNPQRLEEEIKKYYSEKRGMLTTLPYSYGYIPWQAVTSEAEVRAAVDEALKDSGEAFPSVAKTWALQRDLLDNPAVAALE
ncbi:uncharacterized protein SCHCODRAFT_02673152 [Schizophyllum commune H4-8]|uniref:C2H2-type domain-containing protein n=1 Tax=Schizophyllum commune (strain H4-8 / FGSC 9210) TaxID=578458 RepID=D8QIR2_SCHCM|nr:uncharacterized protein SCHCODRAFT_02673152 [Schizophyllum commune H4-8]KAI5886109.1 hypothetical protein SCHCODRAFT_02673152 [Schizophyllum commune H4-8]